MTGRSFTGHHNLLPAAEERGTVIVSIVSAHTLFVWTFGSGTVFWRIWPAVLMHTLFATAVTIISMRTNIYLGIPNVMLTVLGVVIGFVISYRASSGYDRYWMGRTSWTDLMRNARALSRLAWFHIPLRLTPKTPEEVASANLLSRPVDEVQQIMKEKRAALDLIDAFAVAVKHHLRGELGIYYEDLYPLTKPLHLHRHRRNSSDASTSAVASSFSPRSGAFLTPDPIIAPINSYGTFSDSGIRTRPPLYAARGLSRSSSISEHRALLPSSREGAPGVWSQVSADLIPFANYFRGLFSFYRPIMLDEDNVNVGGEGDGEGDGDGEQAYGEDGGVQRKWAPRGGDSKKFSRKHRPRVAGNGQNIPIEILRALSDWLSVLEDRGTTPGTSLGPMIGCIAALEDSLSTLERILTTPLPFVFSVHIRHTVWIYLFFLPFQLVDQFAWYTIPGVAIAAFIYLGFLAAGEEIEQPFGYDEHAQNDLDLDMFCREIVHADIERLKLTPGANVFLGAHHKGDEVEVAAVRGRL
ncbi:UPF0187-domain-containing protein [Auriscalpium vulgare]|uniref:UPF0187-domain-containing protein n=1 Tax=Auriscalpium vulgare TaxID=40419 RepID=A0ACB8RX79_9AGAM|nr:UPF0187-domain-containing protein [Auriscalpium vulgare]